MPVALVVEDHPDLRSVVAFKFRQAGFEVHEESDTPLRPTNDDIEAVHRLGITPGTPPECPRRTGHPPRSFAHG